MIATSQLSDINWRNLMRKSLVSFLSPSNLSGRFPSSHPHLGWSVVVCRSAILKGSSPVPHGALSFAVDNCSGMASSCSISDLVMLPTLDGGLLCLCISAGVGSLLSMRAWRSIPGYARWVTCSLLLAGHMAVRHPLCMAVSNHTPPKLVIAIGAFANLA